MEWNVAMLSESTNMITIEKHGRFMQTDSKWSKLSNENNKYNDYNNARGKSNNHEITILKRCFAKLWDSACLKKRKISWSGMPVLEPNIFPPQTLRLAPHSLCLNGALMNYRHFGLKSVHV